MHSYFAESYTQFSSNLIFILSSSTLEIECLQYKVSLFSTIDTPFHTWRMSTEGKASVFLSFCTIQYSKAFASITLFLENVK